MAEQALYLNDNQSSYYTDFLNLMLPLTYLILLGQALFVVMTTCAIDLEISIEKTVIIFRIDVAGILFSKLAVNYGLPNDIQFRVYNFVVCSQLF